SFLFVISSLAVFGSTRFFRVPHGSSGFGAVGPAGRTLHHRQIDGERCALIEAGTRGLNRSAMKLYQVLGNRQADAKSPCRAACWCRIGLSKSIEHKGKEFRRDTAASVLDQNANQSVPVHEARIDAAAVSSELDGVVQEIPHNLLHSLRIRLN